MEIKVNFSIDTESRPIKRINDALIKYKPNWVMPVNEDDGADISIFHVQGRHDKYMRRSKLCKKYIACQYCIKTTRNKNKSDWIELWDNALMVWSYYDLNLANQCFSPLGADTEIFYDRYYDRNYTICVVGHGWLFESAREIIYAVAAVGGRMAFVGNLDRKFDHVDIYKNISDIELAELYNRSLYVSGLRRIEGFEMPAAEGACCGAMPILYDIPCYRNHYNGIGVFIPETNRSGIIQDLKRVLSLIPDNSGVAGESSWRFDWKFISKNFWNSVEKRVQDGKI